MQKPKELPSVSPILYQTVIKNIIHITNEPKKSFGFGKKDSNILYSTLYGCPICSDEINFALELCKAICFNMFQLWSKINVRMVISNSYKSDGKYI